jgi:photosystem II stability/assembly factor-like uncharacterized protein
MSHPRGARPRFLASVLGLFILTLIVFPQTAKKPQRIMNTDPQQRLAWFDNFAKMSTASKFKDLKWQFLGPNNISGRVTDVAVVAPKGRNYTIYAATASGGVWKTENEGVTWAPVFENAVSTAIGDIALDPSNPQTIWVGTGECNIFRSSQAGAGVYKSNDGGKTWNSMGLAATQTIARIVVHPKNGDVVFVAASGHEWTLNPERGVYKTVDGGRNWEKVLSVNDETGAIDLVMDPKDNDTLYAATWQRTRKKWNDPRNDAQSSGSGIWKTMDAGKTWKPVNNGLPEAKFRGRIGIDLCKSKPSVLYAYIDNYEKAREATPEELADSYGIPSGGFIKASQVYRSNDKGESWTLVCPTTPQMKSYMERHSGTYGWVFGQIRVDPNDENILYTMGLSLNTSMDGGKTLTRVNGPGVDHHALWIDPENSNYLLKGFDQGIAVSYDKGKNWRYFQKEIPVCQFFNVNYDMATPFKVYGSMQDHGSFRGVVDLSRGRDRIPTVAWENAPGGEGSNQAIDPNDPAIVYSAGFYGTLSRTEYKADGNRATYDLMLKISSEESKLRGQWLAPFILSPSNPNVLYHGMQYLFRSFDRGDTLTRISPDLTNPLPNELGDIPYHTIFAIAESPFKFGLVYVGTDDGNVWVTKDGGKKWDSLNAGLPYQKWVSRLVASEHAMSTVYITQNGKRDDDFAPCVWKSNDYGKTWIDISKGIPLGPVNVIREDPVDSKILYVGTDGGVFVSMDQGQTWQTLGAGLPMVYVHDLIIHPRDNIIVIATHGRGMWALDANPINHMDKRPRQWFED